MNLFVFLGIKPKKQAPGQPPTLPPGVQKIDAAKLLQGIPHLHPGVERLSDRRYGCLLAWPVTLPQSTKKKTWLGRFFFAGPKRKRRLVLDDLGRRTVELIDGQRNLAEIATLLACATGHDQAAMEKAVLTFVGQLVRRNAAALTAPKKERI